MRKPRAVLTPGKVIKELRLKKGWSQATLADLVGMAPANLSNIEAGRSSLGDVRAILLAEALGVKPEFLLFPNGFEREDLKPKINSIRKKLRNLSHAS